MNAYIIDTGVRITHRDFGGRARNGRDFVDNDAVAQDGNGHGTHVAGTVAGTLHGVAKRANIVAVRVLNNSGSGTIAGVVAGVNWVASNHVKPAVANMSLGGGANTSLDNAVHGRDHARRDVRRRGGQLQHQRGQHLARTRGGGADGRLDRAHRRPFLVLQLRPRGRRLRARRWHHVRVEHQ